VQEFEGAGRVVIVAAHPDDEVIGAGILLASLKDIWIVHTTNGSPRDLADARRSGCSTQEDYANARRREFGCAMRLAGVPLEHSTCLNFTDQETMHHMAELCTRVAQELRHLSAEVVLTHPYEGGHPDHDSTAFAVHRCFRETGRLFEMTSYHSREGVLETGKFLPNGEPAAVRELRQADKLTKESMLACFQSQQPVLRDFPVVPEQFRPAPRYDFTKPPHAGTLHYERLPWGITGQRWRELAAECEHAVSR
jgi:LmbE family N-acetylglucosaminyl deacetylase